MAARKASRLFFLEHLGVDFKEEDVELDRLEDYFKIPIDAIVRDPKEDLEFQKSIKSIEPNKLVFDLENPIMTQTHLPIEDYQAENFYWNNLREEGNPQQLKKKNEDLGRETGAISPDIIKAMQMDKQERAQYIKENRITDVEADPLASYLKTKWELKQADRAEKKSVRRKRRRQEKKERS